MIRSTSLCITCKQKLAVQRGTDPVTLQCRRQCLGCMPASERYAMPTSYGNYAMPTSDGNFFAQTGNPLPWQRELIAQARLHRALQANYPVPMGVRELGE
jgi:hypothetical protein